MLDGRPWCLWARFQQNLAQTCPVVRSRLGRGRGPGRRTVECTVAIVYSRSPEPRKYLWFTRLRKCALLLQLPSYLRVAECAGIWAWSELCIRARLRVDLLSTLALPLQEVSTHQNPSLSS